MSTGVFLVLRRRARISQPSMPGQHHVENDGVVVRAFGVEEPVIAVVGGIHGITLLAQRLGEAREQVGFVFDDQDSHVRAGGF